MTKISGAWINNPATQQVCKILTDAGYQVLFVGGCVRNAILDAPVNDIDIATDAVPQTVLDLFNKHGFKTIPTGLDHGTVTIVANDIPHEITTFRKDVETFGRHALVEHTSQITEDARRRDFTMNALYSDPGGAVVDPLGGMPDLKSRNVRFIEDPNARITEDYLRILRFFRFHAWYGDATSGLDADGLAACANLSEGLESLSKERIGSEILKLLAAHDPAPSVAAMAVSGCLQRVLPGSDPKPLAVLVHLESELDIPPDPIRRLAILGGSDVQANLRLSKSQERKRLVIWKNLSSSIGASELAYRHGAKLAMDANLVKSAMFEMPLSETLVEDIALGANAVFPIGPVDLPDLHGPALGSKLKDLETLWIGSEFKATKVDLLQT